jgi:hypothetical protein
MLVKMHTILHFHLPAMAKFLPFVICYLLWLRQLKNSICTNFVVPAQLHSSAEKTETPNSFPTCADGFSISTIMLNGINVNARGPCMLAIAPIYLCPAKIKCWKCGADTKVFSLLASDIQEETDKGLPDRGERVGYPNWIYDVDELPPSFEKVIEKCAPNFRLTFSRMAGMLYWGNLCDCCEILQGVHFLHGEPDGPFFRRPTNFPGPDLVLLAESGEWEIAGNYSLNFE